jgi:hypothetical protein
MDEVTFEIQFERIDLITGMGLIVFALGVEDCRLLRCVARFRQAHDNELARYDVHVFWFGLADDHIGPLVCATRNDRAGCRALT